MKNPVARVSFCHSEENVLPFCFSLIECIPKIWSDQYLTVSIPRFIEDTLEVYNFQKSLDRKAAEVSRGLVEILQSFPPSHSGTFDESSPHCPADILPLDAPVNSCSDHSKDSNLSEQSNDQLPAFRKNGSQQPNPIIPNISTPDVPSFQLTTTERGGQCLMESSFVYTKHRVINDKVHWQCIQRGVCKARIHTVGNNVIARKNEHTHKSNSDTFQCLKMKARMKRSASLTQQGTHSILTNSVSEQDEASAVKLPKLDSLKQTVHRERKRTANVPQEPKSLNCLEIPEEYRKTDKGQHFFFLIQVWIVVINEF